MRAHLKQTLVILLALRVIAAPITLRPATPSVKQSVVIRMRCWPPQQLQRFSARSKLLQLCLGKNPLIASEEFPVPVGCPALTALHSYLAVSAPDALSGQTGHRSGVYLRC